jgi:mono/diheme cytochrome c family protein
MMRLMRWHPAAIRYAPGVASCACLLVAAVSLTGHAGQLRSPADGVYSTEQAARGRQVYQPQCADCHGNTLEGSSGPPLAGMNFLSNWSARPLTNLVDKIQKTMPFDMPATLSRQQSIDLAAFILQAGKFPVGQVELSDAMLAQIAFPAAQASPVAALATGASLAPPEGNLAELMRAIAFPNSNIIFNVQLKDPGAESKKELAKSPFDYVVWGSTVYAGWLAVDQAAVAITETAALLLTPGRLCQNGKAVPVNRSDWKQYVAALADAGKLARRTSQARNYEAFGDVSEKLNDACASCHKVYRDKGGTEGSGAARCQ